MREILIDTLINLGIGGFCLGIAWILSAPAGFLIGFIIGWTAVAAIVVTYKIGHHRGRVSYEKDHTTLHPPQ